MRAWALALLLCACDEPPAGGPGAPSASASAALPPHEVDESVVPPRRVVEPNPLGLPPMAVKLAEGARVFAVPERMLASAKLGGSLELLAAKVEGMDGGNVVVRIGHGAAYAVHPGYLVVPRAGRVQHGTRVIARFRDKLRHAIVQRAVRDKIAVRYTDAESYLGDRALAKEDVGVLAGGLEPGAYALRKTERGFQEVLLISAGDKTWLALGAAGEAELIAEHDLAPVPDPGRLKPGAAVLVDWRGDLVPATLRAVDPSGLYTVKRPRLGPALVVGPDMLVPAASAAP